MELPNYIPTRLPSYELLTRRFNRHHRNHSQPCVLPANHETGTMSQREALTPQSPLFRNTPRGRLAAVQTRLGGRGTPLQTRHRPRGGRARMRLSHSQVTRSGDEKSGATPQVWVRGLRFKMVRNEAQQKCGCSALREASTSKKDTSVSVMICPTLGVRRTWIA